MSALRVIVVGLGVQGQKRRTVAGKDYVASVDPVHDDADYKRIDDVPLDTYDAALCCVPDEPKVELLEYLLGNGKHVLVEKPLWAENDDDLQALETLAEANKALCYTAYNHRFEPHFAALRDIIRSGKLGRIYRCRMFYGNGTARLVRNSEWRDAGSGVLHDLGSHLLDTLVFWFGTPDADLEIVSADRFENMAPDHVVVAGRIGGVNVELEMTLLSWRNHHTTDVFAENGSAHISSLCKWGPSSLTVRQRVLPSGRPPEDVTTLVQDDPTWALEYAYFKELCAANAPADLSQDIWLNAQLRALGQAAIAKAAS